MSAYHAANVLPERLDDSEEDLNVAQRRWSTPAFVFLFMVLFSCCFVYIARGWQLGFTQSDLTALEQKQVAPPSGGTAEFGPSCPSQCGNFIPCEPAPSNSGNLLQLVALGRLGLYPLPWELQSVVSTYRLFNKQVTPMLQEFQCPDTDCMIPNAFVNDDFCDCPGTCADEDNHTCETCDPSTSGLNTEGSACPAICGSLASNPVSCLGTGATLGGSFVCPGTDCEIDPNFVNDDRCDCPDCADEDNWNCSTCACPTICGIALYSCDGSGVFSCPPSPDTNQTCNIPGSSQEDGFCNCPGTCEDEAEWTCDNCRCPVACGQVFVLNCSLEEEATVLNESFACNDGCLIPQEEYDNDVCDCPQCEDEPDWDCSTCDCPSTCFTTTVPCTQVYYRCPGSGCPIYPEFVNDNYCDCDDCSDEDAWSCETCDYGCGQCGQARPCDVTLLPCPGPLGAGCAILSVQVNDNACDCPDCSDEVNWNCSTCDCEENCFTGAGGLDELSQLRRPRYCGNLSDWLPAGAQVQCPGGDCPISPEKLEDGLCDCPGTCSDEGSCSVSTPASCGTPSACSRRLGKYGNYSASKAGGK